LLVSHQDALLMGGKVQTPPQVMPITSCFFYPELCEKCGAKVCIELCSGQAIAPGEGGRAVLRPREMRPLRRVSVELLRKPSPENPDCTNIVVSRRHGRIALGGKLTIRGRNFC
jgi:electron-transferring-flavoprotein dehydrogenase